MRTVAPLSPYPEHVTKLDDVATKMYEAYRAIPRREKERKEAARKAWFAAMTEADIAYAEARRDAGLPPLPPKVL